MFSQIVRELLEAGLSEIEIARRVNASQATINRIKHGRQTNIRYDIGSALIRLHGELCRTSQPEAGVEPIIESGR